MLSQIWFKVQTKLFPFLAEVMGTLSEKQKRLVAILEVARVEEFVERECGRYRGRPKEDRRALARAFIAKMVYDEKTTSAFIEEIKSSKNLRRICGWEMESDIPSEATFSRAFEEFSLSDLPNRAHKALVEKHEGERIVGHISRDSTDIIGREKVSPKPPKEEGDSTKRKRGRPRKGEEPAPRQPNRIEKQIGMSVEDILKDLPTGCDCGMKKKNGRLVVWKGYKFHVDWADGEIPISAVLTSASVHDSQAAIPLAKMSVERVDSLYDLMDAAYDAKEIEDFSRSLGHVPIIDQNRRKGKKEEIDPAQKLRYNERSTAERGFSLFKENFGGRNVRVKGHIKVFAHLMFGILALTADRLLNLVT